MNLPSDLRSRKLRQLITKGPVMMPGAFNALTARMIERAGFEAIYLSGAVLSNSVGGLPDIGLMTLSDLERHVLSIAGVSDLPLLADIDTGFGGPENAARAITLLEHAGLSGIHIEDQRFPKRCGHLSGKELVSVEEMAEKVQAAAESKRSEDFIVLARTDARGVTGYDDAVKRAHAYLKAGADGIFPEALASEEEFERFARDVPTVLLANITEFGKSPLLKATDYGRLGYQMLIYPVTLQRVAMKAVEGALHSLKTKESQADLISQMQTRAELYDLIDYQPKALGAEIEVLEIIKSLV